MLAGRRSPLLRTCVSSRPSPSTFLLPFIPLPLPLPLLVFRLPPTPISLLQPRHARFADFSISDEERFHLVWLHHGGYFDLVFLLLVAFAVCGSDEDWKRRFRVQVQGVCNLGGLVGRGDWRRENAQSIGIRQVTNQGATHSFSGSGIRSHDLRHVGSRTALLGERRTVR